MHSAHFPGVMQQPAGKSGGGGGGSSGRCNVSVSSTLLVCGYAGFIVFGDTQHQQPFPAHGHGELGVIVGRSTLYRAMVGRLPTAYWRGKGGVAVVTGVT